MVAGHYQPLADDGAKRSNNRTVRPNLSSAVGSEDEDKQADMETAWAFSSRPGTLVFGLWKRKSAAPPEAEGGRAARFARHRRIRVLPTSLRPWHRRLRASSSPRRRRPC